MTNGQTEPAHSEPTPLDRDEITAVVGAVMIVAGVFCPALTLTNSFFATFGIALWYDEVREPVRTFFGTIQAEIRPTAWILIGIGAVLVALAGYRARGCDRQCTQLLTPSQRLTTAGIILATLAVVLSAQVPRLADRVLQTVTGITWLPYLTVGVLLLVMGEFGDLIFAAGMALREVPNEYLEPCGLSSPEGRVLLLILVGALAWSIFLSFCTTPVVTPAGQDDTTLRRPSGLGSDSHAAS